MTRRVWPAYLLGSIVLMACGAAGTRPVSFSSPSPSGWPSTDNHLTGIACPDITDCVVVGYLAPGYNAVGVHNRTLIEENNGGRWHVVVSPNAEGKAGSALYGVTCLNPRHCIAVGDSKDAAANKSTLIEENTGDGWTVVASPHTAGSLAGVACTGPGHCIAVGRNEAAGTTLIEENTGGGWQVVRSAEVSSTVSDWLSAVACPGPTFCVAVGGASPSLEHRLPVVEENSGSGWAIVPVSGDGELLGVACPSPGLCVATGSESYADTNPNLVLRNVIEELTSGKWSSVTPPAGVIGEIGAVSCSDPGYCISVGRLGGLLPGVIERINQRWSIGAEGSITNTVAGWTGVTCQDKGRCIAVGEQVLGGPADYIRPSATLIAEHTSQGWAVQDSPNL